MTINRHLDMKLCNKFQYIEKFLELGLLTEEKLKSLKKKQKINLILRTSAFFRTYQLSSLIILEWFIMLG